jgi:hypothetical protein
VENDFADVINFFKILNWEQSGIIIVFLLLH